MTSAKRLPTVADYSFPFEEALDECQRKRTRYILRKLRQLQQELSFGLHEAHEDEKVTTVGVSIVVANELPCCNSLGANQTPSAWRPVMSDLTKHGIPEASITAALEALPPAAQKTVARFDVERALLAALAHIESPKAEPAGDFVPRAVAVRTLFRPYNSQRR